MKADAGDSFKSRQGVRARRPVRTELDQVGAARTLEIGISSSIGEIIMIRIHGCPKELSLAVRCGFKGRMW